MLEHILEAGGIAGRDGPQDARVWKEKERNHHRNWPDPLSLTVCSVQGNTKFVIILQLLIVPMNLSSLSRSQYHACVHSCTTTKVYFTDVYQHLVENMGRNWGKNRLPVYSCSRHSDL